MQHIMDSGLRRNDGEKGVLRNYQDLKSFQNGLGAVGFFFNFREAHA